MVTPRPCGACLKLRDPVALAAIWQDERWVLRPIDPPAGVPGWMVLMARRHAPGPGHLDDAEAATFGPVLRHVARALERVTGASRIYTAALGEAWPHFHCHLVPRAPDAPAIGWSLFDRERAAKAGELTVDPADVERITAALAAALQADPPPPGA